MVGELDLLIAGQRASIEFLNDHAVVCFPSYASAFRVTRSPLPDLGLVGRLLKFGEIGLKARVGQKEPIELFPKPNLVVRWLSPAIRTLIGD